MSTAALTLKTQSTVALGFLPGVGAGHTLGVDIVTQLLSTVVDPSPDVDLERTRPLGL